MLHTGLILVSFWFAQMGKPRGINTARHQRVHRREQRWNDISYKKAHLGTALKANPFGGASHAKGIVVEKIGVEAKQPNSAIRKCVRVQLIKNGKDCDCFCTCGRASCGVTRPNHYGLVLNEGGLCLLLSRSHFSLLL